MGKNVFIPSILIFILVSTTSSAASVLSLRKLIASQPSDESNPLVSSAGSPVNQTDTNSINFEKPEDEKNRESQMTDKNNGNGTKTLPDNTTGGGKPEKEIRESQMTDKNKGNGTKTLPDNTEGAGNPGKEENIESQMTDKNDSIGSNTLPDNTKGVGKKENDSVNSNASSTPSGNQNGTKVDQGKGAEVSATAQPLGNNISSCEGSLTRCMDKEMIACIEVSKDGSKKLSLVVMNEGESTLKVDLNIPNALENPFPVFEVPKHGFRRVYIEPEKVGKSTELLVYSANGKCVLPLVHPISVDNFILQFSFYSKQVTPIYAAYTLFILALLFGGTWACCKFRKKSRQDGNGIPYQELEMGLPESASAVNVDTAEGWDHDWDDDDDWDEDTAVKSPGGHIPADGLTSRSSKINGWDNDWDD